MLASRSSQVRQGQRVQQARRGHQDRLGRPGRGTLAHGALRAHRALLGLLGGQDRQVRLELIVRCLVPWVRLVRLGPRDRLVRLSRLVS